MSFLTGQDRTPKFAGQVLLDQTESGPIFLHILPYKNTQKNYEKNFEKKKMKKVRILKFCRTSGPDVMSGRAPP